jgi:hypothetical protein
MLYYFPQWKRIAFHCGKPMLYYFPRWKIITPENSDMTKTTDKVDANEAQQMLDSIQKMEGAGLQHAMPPRWFGITIALLVGALIFVVGSGLSQYTVLVICLMALVMAYQHRKAGAAPKAVPANKIGIAAMIGLVLLFLFLVAVGRAGMEMFNLAWAPLATGAVAAIVVFALSVSERREYFAKINGEDN